jgi:Protein of unknown function (DUF3297)
MNDLPPDRLCVDPASSFYDEAALARGVGVRFKGVERRDVEEYCVSENWIRAAAGKALDRRGGAARDQDDGQGRALFSHAAHERQSVLVRRDRRSRRPRRPSAAEVTRAAAGN